MTFPKWGSRWVLVVLALAPGLSSRGQTGEGLPIRRWSLEGGEMMLQIATEFDRRYRIQVSSNLVDWATDRVSGVVDGTLANFFVPAPAMEARFYRVSLFNHEELRADLAAARERWSGRGWTAYSFEMQWTCHCPYLGWVRVVVDGKQVVEVRSVETGELVPPDGWGSAATVEGLFDRIQSHLDFPAVEARAVFDPESGYPQSASSDLSLMIADDETGFEVRAFQAGLPGAGR